MYLAILFLAMAPDAQDGQVNPVPTPNEAVGWAISDLAVMSDRDQPFQRYIWLPPWAVAEWLGATSFAVNSAASRNPNIVKPFIAANGWMMRFDLRELAPEDEDLLRLIKVWDGMAIDDPYFHVTQDNSGARVAVLAPHIDQSHGIALAKLNRSAALVYRADWLLALMLSTTERGRYRDFTGMRELKPNESLPTEEAILLSRWGIYVDLSASKQGDRRVGIFFSKISAKPRAAVWVQGIVGSGFFTEDIFDEDINADRHPIYNLIEFPYRGREWIVILPNGLLAFFLTDADGRILDEAPANLVCDHMIPNPYTKRLQGGAISCIRCHAPGGGFQDINNDVADLLAAPLRVFGDLGEDEQRAARIRIEGLYAGTRFQRELVRARDDFAEAIGELTSFQNTPEEISLLVAEIYHQLRYDLVDSRRALLEIGYDVSGDDFDAVATFQALVDVEDSGAGTVIAFEDPTIAALYVNKSVTRRDFERVFGDLMLRAQGRPQTQTENSSDETDPTSGDADRDDYSSARRSRPDIAA